MNAVPDVASQLHAPAVRPPAVRPLPKLRLLQVMRVETPTPRMRRITLGGPDLAGFASGAADDHVKLLLPAPGTERPAMPTMSPDGPVWPEGAPRPAMRDYTPRRYDPDRGELIVEFVLHDAGPASDWAAQAAPGQWIGVGGPRGSRLIPDTYDGHLLAGDETALPSIARRLEEMTPGTPAVVLIEVADRLEERYLPTAASADVRWLHRNGRLPGDPHLLHEALPRLGLPPGKLHAWIAAEIEVARGLRRALLDAGRSRADIHAAGYWRLGIADAHAKIDD